MKHLEKEGQPLGKGSTLQGSLLCPSLEVLWFSLDPLPHSDPEHTDRISGLSSPKTWILALEDGVCCGSWLVAPLIGGDPYLQARLVVGSGHLVQHNSPYLSQPEGPPSS